MNKKDNVNWYAIVLIGLIGFFCGFLIFSQIAYNERNNDVPLTYNTIITNPYQGCVKGYCSMEGFKCLDEPQKPFTIDNTSCQCNEKGYECETQ